MDAPKVVIQDPNSVQVTFVNDLSGIGFLNGNINLTLTVARWTPEFMGQDNISADLIVAARLRMDLMCAQVLRDALTKIIDDETRRPSVN
jgi:hypothetical protein